MDKMKPEYLRAEQSDGSQVIDILLTNGGKEKVLEKDVIAFLEAEGMNVKVHQANDSWNNDPCWDYPVEETIDPIIYLHDDAKFQNVCKLYYKHLIETRK